MDAVLSISVRYRVVEFLVGRMRDCGLDSCGSEEGVVAGSSENDNEPRGFTRGHELSG